MSLEKTCSPFKTLAFRVAVSFAGLFALASLVIFSVIYIVLGANLNQRTDQELLAEIEEIGGIYRDQGLDGVRLDFTREQESAENTVFARVLKPDKTTLVANNPNGWRGVEPTPVLVTRVNRKPVFETRPIYGRRYGVRVGYIPLNDENILEVGRQLRDASNFLEDYRKMSVCVVAIMLGLATVAGWYMAHRAMRGVDRVTLAAMNMGGDDLSQRVPVSGRQDEIDRLAESFNGMADRIQLLVSELKEISSDIAHDLRSPITRMRGLAEATLLSGGEPRFSNEFASDVIEECDRLIGITNTILELAEVESGAMQMARAPVNLVEMVEAAGDLFQTVAEEKNIRLEVTVGLRPLIICGNISQLQRVIANLLDNAIKFTPPGGTVKLALNATPDQVEVSIADSGIGIREKDIPHIFDRFYRCDPSRSTSGSGLGLSLVRALVKAHGGVIEVKSVHGSGSTFTIHLPRT